MIVFILRSVNPEEKPHEATSVSVYSTRALAIDAFEKEWTDWNDGLDLEADADVFVNVPVVVQELSEDGFVEILSGYHTLDEYELDSGKVV